MALKNKTVLIGQPRVDLDKLDWKKARLIPLPLAAMPADMRQAMQAHGMDPDDETSLQAQWTFEPNPVVRIYVGEGFKKLRKQVSKKMDVPQAQLTNPMLLAGCYICMWNSWCDGQVGEDEAMGDLFQTACMVMGILGYEQIAFFQRYLAVSLGMNHFQKVTDLWIAAAEVANREGS